MPELPEVETTRRGIAPHITGVPIAHVEIRQPRLRWPIAAEIGLLQQQTIHAVTRRGKYLLFECNNTTHPITLKRSSKPKIDTNATGTMIIHLGMSGSLRICTDGIPLRTHDHLLINFDSGKSLRLHDPRRFGCALWCHGDPMTHTLLAKLGPEPLSQPFDGDYLFQQSRKRKVAIKNFIMNSQIVVGVGNIYACESLHMSRIRPGRAAMRVTRAEYHQLADNIKRVLQQAINMGGTTLRDFVNSDGEPGYFAQNLLVYGRSEKPCRTCETLIRNKVIGQRSSFYCPTCQS